MGKVWEFVSIEVRTRKGEKIQKEYPISLIKLSDLIPHEMTIDYELEKFIKGVQESGMVYWPLLVDQRSNLVLDGHHRTAGLSKLNYTNVPVVYIDYTNDDFIQVDTWYPIVDIEISILVSSLMKKGMKVTKLDNSKFEMKTLKNREFTAFIGNSKEFYQVRGEREEIFGLIRDKWLNNIIYYDDPYACLENTGDNQSAVIAWSYTKDEIVEKVLDGKIFLPKTTRHELKFDIMKCNYPLDQLDKKTGK